LTPFPIGSSESLYLACAAFVWKLFKHSDPFAAKYATLHLETADSSQEQRVRLTNMRKIKRRPSETTAIIKQQLKSTCNEAAAHCRTIESHKGTEVEVVPISGETLRSSVA
jgi:hypothetical protein